MGNNMAQNMGLNGLGNACFKRKFRWMFKIDGVVGPGVASGISALPPLKSARPNISFKETEVQHLNEVIYYPVKPEPKTFNLSLYDVSTSGNPVFDWIKKLYDPSQGTFSLSEDFKKEAKLELFDGCGNVLETWKYENVWPVNAEFGELDMGATEYVTVDLTLRYDRAYIRR